MMKKRTIRRLALVFSGILLFQLVHSQEKFLPGYVINLKGDTLHGFIDYRNWKINPDKVDFKNETGNKQITYQPSDILEFKVKDEIYVSATVNIETSPRENVNLNYDNKMNLQVETTFLQTIYNGSKSLYHFFKYDKDYFYIKKDTTFELLLYKRYLYKKDDNSIINENKAYLGQLEIYLKDCPGITTRLKNTAYRESDLNNLFKFYYEGTLSAIDFKKDVEKVKVETGLLAGVSLTSLKFSGSTFIIATDFNSSLNFSAGAYFEIILPRNQKKWSVNNELLLSAYDSKGTYEDGPVDNYTRVTYELGYTYLKLNNLVRYKYPIGHSFLFLNGGISNGIYLKETNYKNTYTRFYTQESTKEEIAINDPKRYELGLIIGGGLKAGRFSMEARYEIGNGMSRVLAAMERTHRIFLLLGFRF